MDKHAVSTDRVVNIDETSCQLLQVHQTGWGRRGVKQAQLQGNARWPSAWTVARWTRWCRSCKRARQTPSCRSSPGRSALTTSRQRTAGHIGRRAEIRARKDKRGSFSGTWPASAPGRHAAAFPHVVLSFLPPRSTSYLPPCDVAVFRSFKSCIQTQASATLARSVLDGTFRRLGHEQSMAAPVFGRIWAARAVTDLCDENKA